MKKGLFVILVFMGCLLSTNAAVATDFDFSGTFQYDNDVELFNFFVGSASTVTVFSSSWDDGGFDPILGIWTASGSRMYQQDDGGNTGSTFSNGISYDHGTWDSHFTFDLGVGDYIATISQYNNFSVSTSLADGFIHDGNPDFTYDLVFGGATQDYFNGVWTNPDPRTGDWAFHILNVEEASSSTRSVVPEPSTFILLGGGLAGLAFVARRRKEE